MHWVETAKQGAAQRHCADKVVKDPTQVLLGTRSAQAVGVGLTRRRAQLQRGAHQHGRHMHLGCTLEDFILGDLAHVRHRRVDLIGGLLLGDRQHRTDIFGAGVDLLAVERRVDILGPTGTIRNPGRHQSHNLRLDLGLTAFGELLAALGRTAGQHQ